MRTLLACASLTLLLTACGFKGPIYLPKPAAASAAKPAVQAPVKSDASAPAAGKQAASAAR